MEKPLVVFGAGGQSKCIINAARESHREVSAIVDDAPREQSLYGVPVFSTSEFHFERGFRFIVAIGDPHVRREKFDWLLGKGGEPCSVIHPSASISALCEIGQGSVVFARAMIDPSVHIGENVIINAGAMVGHDSTVENDAHVSAGAIIGAGCKVGSCAFVGIGAIVNPRTAIGENAFIAMGGLISHDVPANHKAISPHRKEAIILPIAA